MDETSSDHNSFTSGGKPLRGVSRLVETVVITARAADDFLGMGLPNVSGCFVLRTVDT